MFDLTPAEKLLLAENMKVLEAQERLDRGCDDDEVYDLVLAATGSAERASEAYAHRLMTRQRENPSES